MGIGIVNTSCGSMKGIELKGKYEGITEFRGIPYAAPPVGDLRWAPPADPKSWEGVRTMDTYGPMCIQKLKYDNIEGSLISDEDYYYMPYPEMSEDCLYINICTGAQSAGEKRPVYMWYHGGGLTNGYSYEVEFNPEEMARKGAIVVLVGQRLNLFGYISLPQLTKEQGQSGNYGLMDQIKALDWVYNNIEAFGGDPDNITVGGQSGGSHRAMAIAGSPMSKGRVRRVICQSWFLWFMKYAPLKEAEEHGKEYLERIGIDPDLSLEELRKIDANRLFSGEVERNQLPGDMCCDGLYLPFPTIRENLEQFASNVDFLGGTNLGEGNVFNPREESLYFISHYGNSSNLGFEAKNKIENADDFYSHFKELLGDLYDKYDFPSLVKVTDENAWYTARKLATLGLCGRGKTGLCKSVMMHRLFGRFIGTAHPENKVYTYFWTHLEPVRPEDYGTRRDPMRLLAWHSSELWYTFASMREGVPPTRPWREVDYKVADMLSSYWVNFMKTGNPNGDGLPYWPSTGENYGYMELCEHAEGHQGVDSGLDALMYEFACREYEISY